MGQQMLMNVRQSEESRIAVVEDNVLEELYIERSANDNYVGNIYKGVIVNIEPSIQAAFVDFGIGRNGFLHISDVEPHYFKQAAHYDPSAEENTGRNAGRQHTKPLIQDVFHRGDEVIVMVIKEGIGTKGPTLSTYISIPGRYLVLMPSLDHVGVSRKIEDDSLRLKLRRIMNELNPPKGLGFIVRTAGADRSRKELAQDMAYLMRLWKVIVKRIKTLPAPIDIYQDSDMIIRTIRDMSTDKIDKIVIDEQKAYDRVRDFLESVMPRTVDSLEYYDGKEPLFLKYNIENAIAQIHQRRVPLNDGGSIVIDQTEALVAIDVNSGSFRTNDSAEETAFQMNLRAAKEIARQIRLRDLGGVIVNDFIDMDLEQHQRAVERTLRDALKRDRAKTKILRTSPFGLIEMTRQRVRPGVKRSIYRDCPCCHGGGVVKSIESMAIDVMRDLAILSQNNDIVQVRINVADEVSEYLNNKKRLALAQIEEETGIEIVLKGNPDAWPEFLRIECFNKMGNPVSVKSLPEQSSATP
ncbi:MAG: Rne/Rng family ribonuclease [Thermoguttaceae bacterium]|nr:Rne/Rng family ribonuclease [Thermoguttaceae bacterium]